MAAPQSSSDDRRAAACNAVLRTSSCLARAGDLDGAARALEAIPAGDQTADSLALFAKVRAQQGHREASRALWQEAIRRRPDSVSFQAGLAAVDRLGHRGAWIALAGAVLLAAGIFGGTRWVGPARHRPMPAPVAPTVSPVARPEVAVASQTPPTAIPREAPRLEGLESLPARVQVSDRSVRLTFDPPLFRRGVELRRSADRALLELGKLLSRHEAPLEILVEGHTDSRGVLGGRAFRDNESLGFMRAATVVDRLRAGGSLDAHYVHLGSAPIPGQALGTDAASRTASVVVSLRRPESAPRP